jgi:hypothetical protein
LAGLVFPEPGPLHTKINCGLGRFIIDYWRSPSASTVPNEKRDRGWRTAGEWHPPTPSSHGEFRRRAAMLTSRRSTSE